MLNYAPDDVACSAEQWAISWEAEALPDHSLLLHVIAPAKPRQTLTVKPYQPEHVSGYCAAG